MLEREIKLRVPSVDEARAAIIAAGASPLHARRLQSDTIFDTPDQSVRARGCTLRVRHDGDQCVLTIKGPSQPGLVKIREEHETMVSDAHALDAVLRTLGFEPSFRYEKYREEYAGAGSVVIAIDETPIGTFVEIEGDVAAILEMANALGRSPAEFIVDSYRTLFTLHCEQFGLTGADMVFR